eukprot:CAMPEP_0197705504 /NCGR_PEP_ID=MMETSP1338-20131121/126476_1 /TAXON_ID=43686 ORGANISM="Pelagodinium beii, Strain RCC1491" /NCGR_SAMPLE_ID=MMETSP1338 /ASSEMBLY_ACC=CAM_ASM_000754 /LENGTH=434 /DNA_ID=CAMNT_0043289413 /DNA_START=34 /DNA_END=1338 /DNA_ORIENTATION=+
MNKHWFHRDIRTLFPDGLPFWKSFLISFSVSVITGTLQFVVIPNSNPLEDPERRGIWHCAIGCPAIWMPMSILYIALMTCRWVLKETETDVSLTPADLTLMWLLSSICYVPSVYFWNSIWVYPFPYGGWQSAAGGLLALGSTMWLVLYRRLRRSGKSRDEFKGLLFKGALVFAVLLWGLMVLVSIMLLIGASQYVPTWACALIFPVLRWLVKKISEFILSYVDAEAFIVADNLAMTTFSICLTLMVGNNGNALIAVAVGVMDILFGTMTSLHMVNCRLHRTFLWLRNFGGEVTEEQMQRSIRNATATFVASEVGEVIVPVTYCVVFMIVYNGPYAKGYTGIGSSDFGVKTPEGNLSFIESMAVLILADAIGTFVLKYIVNYITGMSIIEEMRKFYQGYGVILTVQAVWIIHTAFCATMMLCALDVTFKLEQIHV